MVYTRRRIEEIPSFYKSGNIYGFMSGDFCGISWHLYLIIGFKNSGKQFNSVRSEDEYVD